MNAKYIAVSVAVLVGTGAVAVRAWGHQAGQSVQTVVTQEQRDQRRQKQIEMERGGLPAAAGVTGRVTVRRPVKTDGTIGSLDDLVRQSELIVIGKTTTNSPSLTADLRSVRSVYVVEVDTALKSQGQARGSVRVVIPGGRVAFSNGSWAQEDTPGFVPPSQWQDYLWFLRRASQQERELVDANGRKKEMGTLYVPVSGPMGLIAINHPSGIARPSGGYDNALARQLVSQKVSGATVIRDVELSLGVRRH